MDETERMPDGLPRPQTLPGRGERPTSGRDAEPTRTRAASRTPSLLRRHRVATSLLLALAVLVALALSADALLREPLRKRMEATLNQNLTGYTARLPDLELHLWSLSVALINLSIRQNEHPNPPVIEVGRLTAGVHWRALLSLRLVADLHAVSPRLHIDKEKLAAEANDAVPVEDKGWQDAIQSIYPLKFNQVRIDDGAVTYVDDPRRPVTITHLQLTTTNIRNVRSAQGTFPSPLQLTATLFDKGTLKIDGAADYLAEPNPAVRADIDAKGIPLSKAAPVADDVGVQITGGVLSANGEFRMVGNEQRAHLKRARIDDLIAQYVYAPGTQSTKNAVQVAKSSAEAVQQDTLAILVDELRVTNGEIGVLNRDLSPAYRVFFDRTDLKVLNVSNQVAQGRGWVMLRGRFMGSGPSDIWMSFLADERTPDMNISVQIRDTDMKSMNDLFRAYGDIDVVAGKFSFFSQLGIHRGAVDGYVKPFFTDIDVYDKQQDRDDSLGQKVYEFVAGGVAKLLRNRNEETATKATISGDVESPDLSIWQVIVNLVRNAFFDSILPGLDQWRTGARRGEAPAQP